MSADAVMMAGRQLAVKLVGWAGLVGLVSRDGRAGLGWAGWAGLSSLGLAEPVGSPDPRKLGLLVFSKVLLVFNWFYLYF